VLSKNNRGLPNSFRLSKITAVFCAPSHIGLLLSAFGLSLCFTRFRARGLRLVTVGAGMLVVMATWSLSHCSVGDAISNAI